MKCQVSRLLLLTGIIHFAACAVEPRSDEKSVDRLNAKTSGLTKGEQWQGAPATELIAILGAPTDSFGADPERGLAASLSWFSYSEDYAAVELLEVESSFNSLGLNEDSIDLLSGQETHECQIHVELSADERFIEQLTTRSLGNCEQWLPLPQRGSDPRTMTVSVDE